MVSNARKIPEDLNFAPPLIEQIQARTHRGESICRFLAGHRDEGLAEEAYEDLSEMLKDESYRRIALYLPFWLLRGAPEHFKIDYLSAWENLLHVADVRENFHVGDCFELDARRDGESEYVVKAAHLTPWLIDCEVLTPEHLVEVLEQIPSSKVVILQGFKEALSIIDRDHESRISADQWATIDHILRPVPVRVPPRPLYVSQRRLEWLAETQWRTRRDELATPHANLDGPFSPNLSIRELRVIAATLEPGQIVLVGGSRLKGYATKRSDYDILDYRAIAYPVGNAYDFQVGNPHAAHIYLNYAWLAYESVTNLPEIMNHVLETYAKDRIARARNLERIEADLLLYRLLHKGYTRFYDIAEYGTAKYAAIDGDCAFYDTKYRTIATRLFAKYVFIPEA